MNLNQKPLAFVDESGFVIPNPTYSTETLKHIKGRFIYTKAEFERAIQEMNRLQDERRELADLHYGGDAVLVPTEFESIGEVLEEMSGERETVPSFTASPKRSKKTGGKSEKLTMPNQAPLPEELHKEPQGVDLTDEERADMRGIDVSNALASVFGEPR